MKPISVHRDLLRRYDRFLRCITQHTRSTQLDSPLRNSDNVYRQMSYGVACLWFNCQASVMTSSDRRQTIHTTVYGLYATLYGMTDRPHTLKNIYLNYNRSAWHASGNGAATRTPIPIPARHTRHSPTNTHLSKLHSWGLRFVVRAARLGLIN